MLTIPNSRGWKARQDIARSKLSAKADPVKIARGRLLNAMSVRDNARRDVERAADQVAAAADQVRRLRGTVASCESWSAGAFKMHPQLVTSRMQVEAAQELREMAEENLAVMRARLDVAERAFDVASGRFISDTADDTDDAIEITPPAAVEITLAARVVAPVAVVPASIDAGVALDRDAAIAALDVAPKRRRAR